MSGKRQHYIPQLLQRGFKSQSYGDEHFTWVFRQSSKPFEANIKNVGVEGYFYSEGNNSEVDESITQLEMKIGRIVRNLQQSDTPEPVSKDIAMVVAHLEARTRHLRLSFMSAGQSLLNTLVELVSDEKSLVALVENQIVNEPTIIDNAIRELGATTAQVPILRELIRPQLGPFMKENATQIAQNFRSEVLNLSPKRLLDSIKTGHLSGLRESLVPAHKAIRYETLNYSIITSEQVSIPLGDSMLVFKVSGSRTYKPFLDKEDQLLAILLPLTPSRILVGSVNRSIYIDFLEIRREIARCSYEHFISSENTDDIQQLGLLIQENAHLLSKSEIEKIVSSLITSSSSI
ncbi:DUF4238 domain-containing protein [Idiomarina aquatica]|uniref:DUF4238 domain-containing protein n=1 Tax=Idiomarina aquatica TaxID=1327752 RepID=A0AA94JEB8_9GAMM|nr:DUF4238 domain-containing protein [Idiomarina aquatica]RUO44491.1 hypothetical protein CWE23_00115 [Idiomarina aquatica]